MDLTINLSSEKISLILKDRNKEIAKHSWDGLYQLSETLLIKIDNFLKKNKISLKQIKNIKVIPSKKSIVSNRIAKAIILGLKTDINC